MCQTSETKSTWHFKAKDKGIHILPYLDSAGMLRYDYSSKTFSTKEDAESFLMLLIEASRKAGYKLDNLENWKSNLLLIETVVTSHEVK